MRYPQDGFCTTTGSTMVTILYDARGKPAIQVWRCSYCGSEYPERPKTACESCGARVFRMFGEEF